MRVSFPHMGAGSPFSVVPEPGTHPSLVKMIGINGRLQAAGSCWPDWRQSWLQGKDLLASGWEVPAFLELGWALENKLVLLLCLIITGERFTMQPAFASQLAISYFVSWNNVTEVEGVIHLDALDH